MEDLAENKKKYKHIDSVFLKINEKFISFSENERKINNEVLHQVLHKITTELKKKDVMFDTMYQRTFYGGSYYDNLRVGAPKEFDLDLIMKLPVICEPKLSTTEKPGFVKVNIKEYGKLMNRPEGPKLYGKFNTLFDENRFLSTSKVLRWFEGLMGKALNCFSKDQNNVYVDVTLNSGGQAKVYLKTVKTGPAFTLKLNGTYADQDIGMDIDLVPCFLFFDTQWPSSYKKNPVTTINTFFIVPKKPSDINELNSETERYWRLSFQEQERELIKGQDLRNMKLTVKLLKKLRDQAKHAAIASYYIKTIFLWELELQKTTDLWKMPLSFTFIRMVQRYQSYLEQRKIPYYWNKQYNLIEHVKPETIQCIANFLKSMITNIERNINDPFVVCDYLLSPDDRIIIENEAVLGKAAVQKLEIAKCLDGLVDSPDSTTPARITKLLVSEPSFVKMAETALNQCMLPRSSQVLPSQSCQSICNDSNVEISSQLKQLNANVSSLSTALYDIQERIFQRFDSFENRLKRLEELVKDGRKTQETASDEVVGDDGLAYVSIFRNYPVLSEF